MLWISAFIVACQDFVIASAISTWYFKRFGDDLPTVALS
jgi:hypothetical protein